MKPAPVAAVLLGWRKGTAHTIPGSASPALGRQPTVFAELKAVSFGLIGKVSGPLQGVGTRPVFTLPESGDSIPGPEEKDFCLLDRPHHGVSKSCGEAWRYGTPDCWP